MTADSSSSAADALRSALVRLRGLGRGAWLAGRGCHENGPGALHGLLVAVTAHRETAGECTVLMNGPPSSLPQGERVFSCVV